LDLKNINPFISDAHAPCAARSTITAVLVFITDPNRNHELPQQCRDQGDSRVVQKALRQRTRESADKRDQRILWEVPCVAEQCKWCWLLGGVFSRFYSKSYVVCMNENLSNLHGVTLQTRCGKTQKQHCLFAFIGIQLFHGDHACWNWEREPPFVESVLF